MSNATIDTAKRVLRFCVGYPLVLCFGTIPLLHAEGRSTRLGPIAAAKYAWAIAK